MENGNVTFSFGRNWEEFIDRYFNEERVALSKCHILDFLKMPNLKGKYFLDVGCGSGLSSLSAFEAGADKIVSFDIEPASVTITRKLKKKKGNPQNWTILKGSILDRDFLKQIEPADITYSWGVLHYTGAMWKALRNISMLIKKNGLLYLALYEKTRRFNSWIRIKKKYSKSSPFGKKIMEIQYFLLHTIVLHLIRGQNPFRYISNYKKNRGMSYWTDVKGWLGGYPYECAKIEEVLQYCREELDLELINIKTGEANIEYLFIRKE